MSELRLERGHAEEADVQDRPLLLDDEQLLGLTTQAVPRSAQRCRGYYGAAAALSCVALAVVALRSVLATTRAPAAASSWKALSVKAQPVPASYGPDDDAEGESVHLKVAKALAGHAQCGLSEKDLDYVTDGQWYDHLDGIPTAAMCCAQCEDSPACAAWTWVEDAKLRGGVPSQCWFKSGNVTEKTPKKGVQSGVLVKGPLPPRPSAGDGVTLYCWSVMRMQGYEKSLVRDQMAHSASIFACDGYTVFSENRTWLTQGPPVLIETEVLGASLNLAIGGATTASWVNTESFFRAWEKIRIDRRYLDFDWVVKVDPDCVFFPNRLRAHLEPFQPAKGRPEPLYIFNCAIKAADGFGMYGSIETVSSSAVDVFMKGLAQCQRETGWRTGWGEDYFLQMCLDKLGVKHVRDYAVVKDANCLFPQPSPCTSGQVAFHPFKSSPGYWSCWNEAGGHAADGGVGSNPPGHAVLPPSDASGEDITSTATETSTTITTREEITTTIEFLPAMLGPDVLPATRGPDGPAAAKAEGSCAAYGCAEVFSENQACQCNSQCTIHQSCCYDYDSTCVRGSAPAGGLDETVQTTVSVTSEMLAGSADGTAQAALSNSPGVGDWVQVTDSVETVQNALSRDNLKWSDDMLVMLGKTFQVVKAPKAGFVGIPSPNGSQGGVWYFPADVVRKMQ